MRNMTFNKIENTLVIRFKENRIEFSTITTLRKSLFDLAKKGHQQFVVDLKNIDRIDSSGIGVFISFWKMFGNDVHMVFCNLQPHIKKVFQAASLLKVFSIAENEHAAMEIVREKSFVSAPQPK